jgi:hypothetical protein
MTARKGHQATDEPAGEETAAETENEAQQAAETVSGDGTGAALPDLANVDTARYAGQIEAAQLAGQFDVTEAPLAELKALGNANPDVNVTAVRTGHGTWYWTARDAVDGTELAKGGPHYEANLIENLTKLFAGQSTVALHRTGDDKARRLN